MEPSFVCGGVERLKMIDSSSRIVEPYKNGLIVIESKPRNDLYQRLIDENDPKKIAMVRRGIDEEDVFKNEPIELTLVFDKNRRRMESSLKTLVRYLWEKYKLPTDGIVEYGSGATGFFDAVLRPDYVPHWIQVEINSRAIAENRRRNPEARVEKGSYKRIEKRDLSMITGLSSWDTTGNLPQAMEQVANGLKSGGCFLHIQDVRPGAECVLSYLDNSVGYKPTHGWAVPVIGQSHQEIFGFLVDGHRRTSSDIFKEAMRQAVSSQPNLDLVVNAYFTLYGLFRTPSPLSLNADLQEIYFLNYYALSQARPKKLPEGLMESITTVLVTLARKKF